MRFDYSPAEAAPRRSARRAVLVASLCVILLAAVATREGVAKRRSAVPTADLPSELAAALDTTSATAFEEAVQSALADPLPAPQASEWLTIEVGRGQTLSEIFEAHGLGFSEAIAVVKLSSDAARLKNLRAGDKLLLRKTPEDHLEELRFELDEANTLHVRRTPDDTLEAITIAAALERRQTQVAGLIENSLFLDGQRAGLSNRLLMQMAELFGYDIDFALDLRIGDRFAVIYEELYKDGKKLRDGDIVAAEFVNRGRSFRAVRYVDADGNVAFYTPEGESLRKAFLRTPVDFARVSSGFNLRRRHPILNTIRAHKGVDYAAGTGTPIKATGDGKVEFIGVKGGYGRIIILKHGSQYTTLYAHMSKYRSGVKVGSRVKQGQVIGYVGATGLATAPHLHYEFRINGVHKNPITVALPRANPLPRSVIARWRADNAHVVAQLDAIAASQMAQAQSSQARLNP
jgi:murein DD-endopeptidase MepM/ murein hydrolase activator NlpD